MFNDLVKMTVALKYLFNDKLSLITMELFDTQATSVDIIVV